MPTVIHRNVEAAQRGENPTVIARTNSGWVVMGDSQVVRGYCLLLHDPVVSDLNALSRDARSVFLHEMSCIGDALLTITGAARMNYAILGNAEPALHAHVFPRYADEPEEHRRRPVWFYDWSVSPTFDAFRDRELMAAIRAQLGARDITL